MATLFEGNSLILVPQYFVKFYLSFIFTYLKNFIDLALKIKKFEFWRARLGGGASRHAQFQAGTSTFGYSSQYDPSAFNGFKVDSDRKKEKKY